jgi:hypothetical protein
MYILEHIFENIFGGYQKLAGRAMDGSAKLPAWGCSRAFCCLQDSMHPERTEMLRMGSKAINYGAQQCVVLPQ